MKGGTTFTFVTDGIESALAQARAVAADANVAIAGGAATVNQYLAAGLLDELRLHVAALLLGAGERLFEGVGNALLGDIFEGARSSVGMPSELLASQRFERDVDLVLSLTTNRDAWAEIIQ